MFHINYFSLDLTKSHHGYDDEKYLELYWIYKDAFYKILKERAINVWLSDEQWKWLCNYHILWYDYTDFFSNLDNEIINRKELWNNDFSSLQAPPTENLESQISEKIIKDVYIEYLFYKSENLAELFNCLKKLDFITFVEKFKNNELWDYIKTFYPLKNFEKEIPFIYNKDELIKKYDEFFREPSYPNKSVEISTVLHEYDTWFMNDFNLIYDKNKENKDSLFKLIRDISDFLFYEISDILTSHFWSIDKQKFELILLQLFSKHKNEIIKDEWLSRFYCWYFIEKIRLLNWYHSGFVWSNEFVSWSTSYLEMSLKIWEACWEWLYNTYDLVDNFYQIYISKDKLEEYILNFDSNELYHNLLQIYKVLYEDILKREGSEQFIKELLYRSKKITDKNDNIVLWLREYLMFLFCNVFIGENGGNKPEYFDSISDDLKEIFWENEYNKFELMFSGNLYSKWDDNVRKKYKMWLVFWDIKSKKAFDKYSRDKKNEKDFTDRQLNLKQFDVLSEEYYDQQNLDIEKKLEDWRLTFVLTFETDHETKLRNLIKAYPDRIIVCDIPWQHFSHTQFCKMLDLWLMNIEKSHKF